MIDVAGVTVRLGGVAVVDDLSFTVPAGGSLALWGTNGAGKTTALRAMLGLLGFDGSVRLGEYDIRASGRAARALVGYVPQQLAFWDDLGALELLQFIARLRRGRPEEAVTLLARVDLADHSEKRVGALSGGMRQRLALAAALLGDPPILLLDEPTSGLDAAARLDFLGLLASLRDDGKTLVVTSHRLSEVQELAESVVVLEAGRTTLTCPADRLEAALYPHTMLRLFVASADEAAAMAALARGGFEAQANGHGIVVKVASGSRAAPVTFLLGERIGIQDLTVEDGAWTLP